MTIDAVVVVPKPDRVVTYAVSSSEPNNGALFLYGDPNSKKIALLCAGFADDQTVFQPFAKALSSNGIFVGVMCLPGYDDRPQDNVPWTNHKPNGYTFEEATNAVRDAAKVLRAESTYNTSSSNDGKSTTDADADAAKFIGIFGDFAVAPGSMWAKRAEEEVAAAAAAKNETTDDDNNNNTFNGASVFKPDRIVFFDVLGGPSPKSKDIPKNVPELTAKEKMCSLLYKIVLAVSFLLQRDISKHLAAAVFIVGFSVLKLLRLDPLYPFDTEGSQALYKESKNKLGLFRVMYMAYPYWSLVRDYNSLGTDVLNKISLHNDWKATPILYLYGPKKRTQFHSTTTLKMLQREETEKRSLSKAIAVEDAGHYLYVSKQEECLKAVVEFMDAENTFI